MCVSNLSIPSIENVATQEEELNQAILAPEPDWKTLFFDLVQQSICKRVPDGFREMYPHKAERAFRELQKECGSRVRFLRRVFKYENLFETLLHACCYDLASALIGPRFDVHRIYSRGQSALSLAAASLDLSIVRELINRGASVNGRLDPLDPKTCLEVMPLMAAMQTHPLWHYDEPEQERRQLEMIRLLLEHRADVNIKKTDGMTPLIFACYQVNAVAVRVLLENHADVSLEAEDGETALIAAARVVGNGSTLQLLLKSGADTTHANHRGENALTCALYAHCLQNVSILLEVEPLDKAPESYIKKVVSGLLNVHDETIKEKVFSKLRVELPGKGVKRVRV